MSSFEVSAPTRADLAGGTIDIWPLYCLFGGAKTINVALSLQARVKVTIEQAVSFQLTLESPQNEKCVLEEPEGDFEFNAFSPSLRFPAFVCHSFLKNRAIPEKNVRLRLSTEAPRQSGLGGSSTLCVALVKALSEFMGIYREKGWEWKILNIVRDIEAQYLKTTTGVQDYLAALFGGLRCYQFGIGESSEKKYADKFAAELDDRMLVLFSGEMHSSGASNWEVYKGALEKKKEVVQGFRSIREIAEEMDVELSKKIIDWKKIGELMNREWEIRSDLFRVDTPRLTEIISFLDTLPILGRKVCGAASGGSLLVICEPSSREKIRAAIQKEGIEVLSAKVNEAGVTVSQAGS